MFEKFKKFKAWCVRKVPKPLQKYEQKHPFTFWAVTITLVVLPFSPVTFALLHGASWLWTWMFAVK